MWRKKEQRTIETESVCKCDWFRFSLMTMNPDETTILLRKKAFSKKFQKKNHKKNFFTGFCIVWKTTGSKVKTSQKEEFSEGKIVSKMDFISHNTIFFLMKGFIHISHESYSRKLFDWFDIQSVCTMKKKWTSVWLFNVGSMNPLKKISREKFMNVKNKQYISCALLLSYNILY